MGPWGFSQAGAVLDPYRRKCMSAHLARAPNTVRTSELITSALYCALHMLDFLWRSLGSVRAEEHQYAQPSWSRAALLAYRALAFNSFCLYK